MDTTTPTAPAVAPNPAKPQGGQLSQAKQQWLKAMSDKQLLSPEKQAWYDQLQKRGMAGAIVPPPPTSKEVVNPLGGGSYFPDEKIKVGDTTMDWNTGIGFSDTSHFFAADNDAERKAVLEQGRRSGQWDTYGVDNTDMGPVWWVSAKGQKRSVIGTDWMRDQIASFWAHPWESIGMTAMQMVPETRLPGAVAKMAEIGAPEIHVGLKYMMKRGISGTVYNAMRASLTGGGALLGYGADEAQKKFDGLWAKSSDEQKAGAFHAFLTGAVAEIIPRLAGSVIRTVGSGYAPLLPAEHRADIRSMIDRGITPGISQATQGKSILLSFEQAIIEYGVGHPLQQKSNFEAIKKEFKKKLMQTGSFSEFEADAAMKDVADSAKVKIDTKAASERLRQQGQATITGDQGAVEAQKRGLEQTLDGQFENIERDIGSPDPAVQARVQQDLVDARVKFGKDMEPQYSAAFDVADKDAAGGVGESAGVKAAAQAAWDSLPKDQYGNRIFKNEALGGIMVQLMHLPAFVELRTLQKLRTQLFQAGAYRDLTPGASTVQFNKVGAAVDDAMRSGIGGNGNPEFTRLLDTADKNWESGIKRFKGALVKQLAVEAERGVLTDPAGMGRVILQKDHAAEAMRIRGLVAPETWKKVAAGYWEKLVHGSSDAYGNLIGKRFSAALHKEGRLLDIAFGREKADQMRKYAARYAALGGEQAAKDIGPDNFMTQLHGYEARRAALDARMKTGFVKMLFEEGPDRRNVIDYMMESSERIAEAKRFYGEASPQWRELKGQVMKDILSQSVARDASLVSSFTKAGQLSGALAKYSDRELAEMFGAETAGDLRKLGKEIDIAGKPAGRSLTGALVVIPLVMHPIIHLGEIAALAVMSQVLSYPKFVRWLATGFEQKTQRNWAAWAQAGKTLLYMAAPTLASGAPKTMGQSQAGAMQGQQGQPGAYSEPDWAKVPQ